MHSNNYYAVRYNDSYLAHYGVPGMKWGVRRWQRADGSLTEAGRKRYGLATPSQSYNNTNGAHMHYAYGWESIEPATKLSNAKSLAFLKDRNKAIYENTDPHYNYDRARYNVTSSTGDYAMQIANKGYVKVPSEDGSVEYVVSRESINKKAEQESKVFYAKYKALRESHKHTKMSEVSNVLKETQKSSKFKQFLNQFANKAKENFSKIKNFFSSLHR